MPYSEHLVCYYPIRYSDPSGHMASECGQDKSECGGSEENVIKVLINAGANKPQFRLQAMKVIAKVKGIHTAPGDHWNYANYISHGATPAYGWTPSRPDDPYYDSNGNVQTANDESVYLTSAGFDTCKMNIECIAGIMAHEATHSWVELKVEQSSTTGQTRTSGYIIPEEMLADAVAMDMGDPTKLLTNHYYEKAGVCSGQFGNACSPISMLESFYGISLSNISQLVYGK